MNLFRSESTVDQRFSIPMRGNEQGIAQGGIDPFISGCRSP